MYICTVTVKSVKTNEMNSFGLITLSSLSLPKFTTPLLSFPVRRRCRSRRRRHHHHSNNRTLRNNNSDNNNNYKYNPLAKLAPSGCENINLVLDLNQISIISSSKSKFDQFLSSIEQAYDDLANIITIDDNGRLLVSCRRSTLQFVGGVLFSGFLLVFVFRVLVKVGLGFRSRFAGVKKQNFVVRRDRSLGGREVVVATGENVSPRNFGGKFLENPFSQSRFTGSVNSGRVRRNYRVRRESKLPNWWPVQVAVEPTFGVDKEEYQREANRLIRAIIDHRIRGQDIMEDDIIQLRRICRISGIRVSIDTINTRDSLYRTSVNFVINVCSSAPSQCTSVQIDGEDAREFVAGLAKNIGLENIHAARMVSAAVAAHTRSCFLQAWASEMQGNHSEAVLELLKICLVFHIFPPEVSSPEMEMVARGLEKLLKFEQRKSLMNMLVGVCNEESHRSAAEALGLVNVLSHEGNADQQEESIPEN